LLKKTKNIFYFLIFILIPNVVFATSIENSKLGTGLKKLLDDLSKWLPVLALATGSAFLIYYFIRRQGSDEMDKKMWTKRIETAIVSTIGAVIGASMLSVIKAYFG
jgi:amino acid permease